MTVGITQRFTLTDERWSEALRLALAPEAWDVFWERLGREMGFDPSTVEITGQRKFTAAGAAVRPQEPTDVEIDVPVVRRPEARQRPAERVVDPLPPSTREPIAATVVRTTNGKLVKLDLLDCPRCAAIHHGILYQKLRRPSKVGKWLLTHWAYCPANGEPMLIQIREDVVDVWVPTDQERLAVESSERLDPFDEPDEEL